MGNGRRIGIVTNVWGWRSLRAIRWWLSLWAFPYSSHGVEITRDADPVYGPPEIIPPYVYQTPRAFVREPQRLHVFQRIVKIGPVWFHAGRFTRGFIDGKEVALDAKGERLIRYPHGRLQHWRTQRRLQQIERDNRRRADERAMQEGCS